MSPHSRWILQKCTIFEGSNTHLTTFLKSPSNITLKSYAGVDVKAPKFWQLVSKVMQLKEYQETELSCNQNTKPVVEGKMLKALDIVEPLYWRKSTLQLMPQASLCHLYVQHLFAASFGKLETMIPDLFTSRPLKLKYVCEASCPLTRQLILGQVCILHLHYLLSDLWFLLEDGTSFLRVHPKFLHSNATSHKWAFGAIAELLDNAVDEIQNGATYAIIDKMLNPKDGTSALLIQDDGGGMDLEAMRCCLSFGFSDKKSKSAIGQYGNGFKTSSMRLGADVVVFSRCMKNRKLTQSVGLLSFTFLTRAGLDRIVVPMIEYEFMSATSKWTSICSEQHFVNNLSLLLQWSPFSTEEELLKQFDSIGDHGTKIVIYNLWLNDEGKMELDFYSDPEDIRISCDAESGKSCSRMSVSDLHLANTLRYSLRAYLSILYLRIPENFCIWLCGQIVEYHNIANDLKYREFILYKPQNGGCEEGSVITSIGFLKEAPLVNIHGFNVYHKNRLILPFWSVVVGFSVNRSRGVVGVLEANFIKPTHNKQDFEKTPLFHKLEHRLKEMTWEYWDHHCGLIGYHATKQLRAPSQDSPQSRKKHATAKRKNCDHQIEPEILKQKAGLSVNLPDPESIQNPPATTITSPLEDQEMVLLLKENKRLHARCLEIEKKEEEFNAKVTLLRKELKEEQRKYARLLVQSAVLENSKREHTVIIV